MLYVLGLIIVIVVFVIGIYNKLVGAKNQVKNAFSQIDVQLTRRHDLIPNLIEAVKGYMKHESETLEAVVNARNAAVSGLQAAAADPSNPEAIENLSKAEGQLNGALGRLFALAEAYPDLKANENMMQFQEELTSTENRVAFARQAFNDAVMRFNTMREQFPNNFVVGFFPGKFNAAQHLQIEDGKTEVPKVSFD
ncbi:MAG: LemA family protein [Gammaproteobacteria bacterium]|nr:LemA family protein [Gammaproteobacteria bacterium]NNC97810.1 LemA family protein [Gammaproteobacteria bacterium]